MADVRSVFRGLWILAVVSVVVLVAASRRARSRRDVASGARRCDRAVDRRGRSLGVVGFFAFDQLFELFHEVFFPAGSYLFDPTTDRLVQLFPFAFWDETAMVVGVVIIVVCAGRGVRGGTARGGVQRPPRRRRTWRPCRNPARERAAGRGAAQRRGRAGRGPRRDRTRRHANRSPPPMPSDGSPPRPSAARVSLPPWPNSAMDGYAIRAADTAGATETEPVELRVIGDIAAGAAPDVTVEPGTAARIATGARAARRRRRRRPGRGDHAARRGTADPGPRGRDATGPVPSACLVHEPVAARRLGPRRRQRPQSRRHAPASRDGDRPRRP